MARRIVPAFLDELSKPPTTKKGEKRARPRENEPEVEEEEPIYPDAGSYEDPVEGVYTEAMNQALEKRDYKTAAEIATKLKRHRAGSSGGRPRTRRNDPDEEESLTSNSRELDINNLAPHADEIASDLFDVIKGLGVIPAEMVEKYQGAAKGQIAEEIRKRPTMVKDVLDGINDTVNKWAGKPGSGKATQQGPKFDPGDPASWPKEWGDVGV